MSTFLQIFGSFASIGAIPLAVYLYLRNREAKFSKLRQEICKILSYQIGEGRNLSTFEVQAVITSKTREHNFKPDAINSDEVIEDLVAETITNPMLESGKKENIIENFQNIHRAGQIHRIVMRYSIPTINLLESISHTLSLTPADSELVKAKKMPVPVEAKEVIYRRREAVAEKLSLSSLFAFVAIIIVTTTLVVGKGSITKFLDFFYESPYIVNLSLGIVVSMIAAFLTYFFAYASRKKKK